MRSCIETKNANNKSTYEGCTHFNNFVLRLNKNHNGKISNPKL